MAKKLLALTVSGLALTLPNFANAQDTAPQATGANDIIVTAQRREQVLTDVPLSISAISGDNLEAKGLGGITDLKFETPGFISLSGTGFTQIYIRGIGNNIFVGADPSVATFIDDVPRIYGSLIDNLVNVERVEVLKGAQGGLYGRNATGGVINIVTRKPSDDLGVKGTISFGEYETVDASAFVNVPLGDRVAVNFSVNRRYHDAYVRNLGTSSPYPAGTTSFFGDPNSSAEATALNNEDFYAFDGKIKAELSDNLTVTLAGDYARKNDANGNGWVQQNTDFNYLVYLGFSAAAGISDPIAPWSPGSVEDQTAYSGIESFSKTEDFGFSGTIDLALASVDLKSITAMRWNNGNFRGDIGGGPVPMAGFFTDFDRKFFYQELRAVSSGDGPLRYIAGATYLKNKIDNLLRGLFVGFPTGDTIAFTDTENWSVYGELSYDLTEQLTLTASLRYVDETTDALFPAGTSSIGGVLPEETNSITQSKLLPSATLSYNIGDGVIYARYARGFKTGGINPIVRPSAFQGQPGSAFGPEVADSFEIGYRASLFDRRVQLTTAIFYNDFSGVQIARAGNAANPTVSNAILNAGDARTYGAEASVTWQVSPALTIAGNIGYLNARYKAGAGALASPVVDSFDVGGNVMSLSPEWQGGASIAVNQPVNDAFRIKGTVLYSHVGGHNFQYEENPFLFQPSYNLVNVRLGVADIDERMGLFVFANNLFDEGYAVFGTNNSLGSLLTPGAPRVIGGTLEFNF